MNLPWAETRSPTPLALDLAAVPDDVEVLSITSKVANFDRISRLSRLTYLWLSGGNDEMLASIGARPHLQTLVLYSFRGGDLTAAGSLPALRQLAVWHAPRLRSLRGLERLGALEKLIVGEVAGELSLDPVAGLSDLTTFSFEGGMYQAVKVPSLAPLERLSRVTRLRLAALRVGDRSLRPLGNMHHLQELFIANVFPLQEFAALAAKLPHAPGDSLAPVRASHYECVRCGGRTVLLTGGRGGLRCERCDEPAIAKHIERFRQAEAAGGPKP